MNKELQIINKLEFDTVCVYGVGVPTQFFNSIKGDKLGVDPFDKESYPRS